MIPFRYVGARPNGLVLQQKQNWAQGQSNAALYFVHGTSLDPATVHRNGMSPAYSREWLVDNNGAPIAGGRLIFSFRVCAGNGLPANADKPGGVQQLWGLDGHMYVFQAPANTLYWSNNGTLGHGQEVAFPYEIESADIVQYWAPSSNYRAALGTARNPRHNFQKVSWNSFLASRTAALNAI
jgi:hypothetical protein